MDNKVLYNMRKSGMTYKEIHEETGINLQSLYVRIKKYENGANRIRGWGFDIERIVYKGLYEYFVANPYESLTSFAKTVAMPMTGHYIEKIKNLLTGEHNSYFSIEQIKKICEVVGKPFEEVFEERETVSK